MDINHAQVVDGCAIFLSFHLQSKVSNQSHLDSRDLPGPLLGTFALQAYSGKVPPHQQASLTDENVGGTRRQKLRSQHIVAVSRDRCGREAATIVAWSRKVRVGRTPRGSCNNTLLRRVLRRFFKGSAS